MVKDAINGCNADMLFSDAWDPLAQSYPDLEDYCGGATTVFPGTSTVEDDLSMITWEKSIHQKLLLDFSLEDVIQSKQYKRLEAIEATR